MRRRRALPYRAPAGTSREGAMGTKRPFARIRPVIRGRRRALGAGMVAATCLTAVVATQSPRPAAADDIVIDIPVSNISQSIVIQPTIIPGDNLSDVSISLPAAEGNSG